MSPRKRRPGACDDGLFRDHTRSGITVRAALDSWEAWVFPTAGRIVPRRQAFEAHLHSALRRTKRMLLIQMAHVRILEPEHMKAKAFDVMTYEFSRPCVRSHYSRLGRCHISSGSRRAVSSA